MKISVKLIENNDEYIANCPELDINCYGSNKNEAIRRIGNVIHFYIHSAKELGLNVENLNEIIIEGKKSSLFNNEMINMPTNSIN